MAENERKDIRKEERYFRVTKFTRRQFLKSAGIVAAGTALASIPLASACKSSSSTTAGTTTGVNTPGVTTSGPRFHPQPIQRHILRPQPRGHIEFYCDNFDLNPTGHKHSSHYRFFLHPSHRLTKDAPVPGTSVRRGKRPFIFCI